MSGSEEARCALSRRQSNVERYYGGGLGVRAGVRAGANADGNRRRKSALTSGQADELTSICRGSCRGGRGVGAEWDGGGRE